MTHLLSPLPPPPIRPPWTGRTVPDEAREDAQHWPTVRVVVAPDKMRGTAPARAVAAAVGRAAAAAGWDCDEVPVADGGEGTLDVPGGPNRTTR